MNEEKKKALDLALSHIEKQYGSGAVMRLGEKPDANVEAIPTGALLHWESAEYPEAGLLKYMDLNRQVRQLLPCMW